MRFYWRRKLMNYFALTLSVMATLSCLIVLGDILWKLFSEGVPHLSASLFKQMTPPPGEKGGLANAIVGSLIMTGLGTLLGTPIGVLAGTFLTETGRRSRLASVCRFLNGILLSSPSIIVGFFIYTCVVAYQGHFSPFSGALALATIQIPLVVANTENMLRLIPGSLREAAAALGTPQWKIIVLLLYRSAKTGLLTGILLGVARISGETAPILFTALNNQFWSLNLNLPMANLPVVIFQFAMSPFDDWQHLAWAGALLITLSVLTLNIVARLMISRPLRRNRG